MSQPSKVHIVSLGCPKNRVDAEILCGELALKGFLVGTSLREADIVLVNTCAFIESAREEAANEINRALRWKRSAHHRRHVVVAGCLPQLDATAAARAFPEVDLFLGVDDIPVAAERIAEMTATASSPTPRLPSTASPVYLYDHTTPRLLTTPPSYAYVKIADGCDRACLFCTIPAIRGRRRIRRPESVETECRSLLDMGVREVILTAQDSTRYGADLQDHPSLATLLRRCDALQGDFWIRVLYYHPGHVTTELMTTLADAEHVVKYVDIPLQHISDSMLKRMGRGMGEKAVRNLMEQLRKRIPGVAVRTTFLVGFPGETEEDFQRLRRFVEEYRFDRLGVFEFSPEPGTPAAEMQDCFVPGQLITERCNTLMATQKRISSERNRAWIGTRHRVLIDGRGKNAWIGRTWADAPEIDNVVRVRSQHRPLATGQFVEVRISDADAYELRATPVLSG